MCLDFTSESAILEKGSTNMANGIEDLHEKTQDSAKAKNENRYETWKIFQGREDAEMLLEKSAGWSGKKASRGDYDSWDND